MELGPFSLPSLAAAASSSSSSTPSAASSSSTPSAPAHHSSSDCTISSPHHLHLHHNSYEATDLRSSNSVPRLPSAGQLTLPPAPSSSICHQLLSQSDAIHFVDGGNGLRAGAFICPMQPVMTQESGSITELTAQHHQHRHHHEPVIASMGTGHHGPAVTAAFTVAPRPAVSAATTTISISPSAKSIGSILLSPATAALGSAPQAPVPAAPPASSTSVNLDCNETRSAALSQLAALCQEHTCRILVHGTPYQWRSHSKSWIVKEKDAFMDALVQHRIPARCVYQHLYYGDQKGSLEHHFMLLRDFVLEPPVS